MPFRWPNWICGDWWRRSNSRVVVVALAVFIALAGVCQADDEPPHLDVTIQRVSSDRKYAIGRAAIGGLAYIDRKYAFRKLPKTLVDQIVVRTSMDDDYAESADHLVLKLSGPAKIYIGIDQRGQSSPSWLKTWKKSTDSLSVDDISYHLYERKFAAGAVTLGGNERKTTGACNNYVVILIPEKPSPEFPAEDFASRIQPLLAARCVSCHGPDMQEGGLRLDVRRRALIGGDTGPAITPYSHESSELIARTTTKDKTKRMPQGEVPLSRDEITLLSHWIDAGAVWPDDLAGKEDHGDHWSFRRIERPEVPATVRRDWGRTPVDAFVLARLEQEGLEPSSEASRRTLIRRLSLDLLGLPPSPEDVQNFLHDQWPGAWERLVDRLLESPHFGERWGKHWLDLARFAESDGYENDVPRPHAYRYRDWVINAVNDDLPFDEFTIRQLAGDLLPNGGPNERIATAFHRNSLHNGAGGADTEEFRSKAVKDRTAVTGAVWMGLTLNCCECHAHKYDPIAHREYYQLYAFFNNADHAQEGDVPIVTAAARRTMIHKRGNFLELGPEVAAAVPAFLPAMSVRGAVADRLDLARWLVSKEHPLTARVAVNHVWQHLFGQGLVPTPENFGRKGEPPSHPELLDWLAAEFAGLPADASSSIKPWSRKSLIRLLVTSSAYRQASMQPENPPTVDPDNRLLWRQNRFRVEAEVVRDLALAASGLLDATVGGPSIQPPLPKGLTALSELKNERFQESSGRPHRRGVYVHIQRTFPYPMIAAFDGPDGNQCTMLRDRSITPMQALTLLNEPALNECARALGSRLTAATGDETGRIHVGFELCLSRPPGADELLVMRQLVEAQRGAGASADAIWHGVARTLLNLDELISRE